jgi:hypothetical protein
MKRSYGRVLSPCTPHAMHPGTWPSGYGQVAVVRNDQIYVTAGVYRSYSYTENKKIESQKFLSTETFWIFNTSAATGHWKQEPATGEPTGIHGRIARGGHGLSKVSLGPTMPYLSTPCRRATPDTAILLSQRRPTHRVGSPRPSSTHLETPCCTPMQESKEFSGAVHRSWTENCMCEGMESAATIQYSALTTLQKRCGRK